MKGWSEECLRIQLTPIRTQLAEVLVRDKSIRLLHPEIGTNGHRLVPGHLEVLPGWGETDILRTVQLMPGVQSINESASDMSIRGGTSDQNLILWDGIPIYHTGHFFGMFSVFNPQLVKDVRVWRGGFSARFGGRTSGVIDIAAKPDQTDSLAIDLGLNLISLKGSVSVPLLNKKSALMLGVRRAFTDDIRTGTFENIFNQVAGQGKITDLKGDEVIVENIISPDPRFFFEDYYLKWWYQPTKRTTILASLFSGNDELLYTLSPTSDLFYYRSEDEVKVSSSGGILQVKHEWKPGWQSKVAFVAADFNQSYDYFDSFNPELTAATNLIRQRNTLSDATFRVEQTVPFDSTQQFLIGFENAVYGTDLVYAQVENALEPIDKDSIFLPGTLNSFFFDYRLRNTTRWPNQYRNALE